MNTGRARAGGSATGDDAAAEEMLPSGTDTKPLDNYLNAEGASSLQQQQQQLGMLSVAEQRTSLLRSGRAASGELTAVVSEVRAVIPNHRSSDLTPSHGSLLG